MKGNQFLLLIVASVVIAANLTANNVVAFEFTNETLYDKEFVLALTDDSPTAFDVVPTKCINETVPVKEICNITKELCDLLQPCLPFTRPSDCEEVRLNGNTTSGVYTIWPKSRRMAGNSVEVYCDMTRAGGGWTVLQRRGQYGNAQYYFNRTWEFYKDGFGELDKEFWLGNEKIHALTNQKSYSVRFDMRLVNGTSAYAMYDQFWIEDEDRKYQLHIDGYSGNAGDSMSYHQGMNFSTWDNDNDHYWSDNCSSKYSGGWWFRNCLAANLNGMNWKGTYVEGNGIGITWYKFTGSFNSLEFTEIKIKPRHFR